jgi:hypothetical protein
LVDQDEGGDPNPPSGSRQPNWIVRRIRIFQAYRKQRRTENYHESAGDRAAAKTALAAIGTLVFTAVIAGATISQYFIFSKQLSVMQGQLNEMRDEQRPWISVTLALEGPITYDAQGARFRIVFTTKNIGHLPATDVRLKTKDDLMKFGQKYDTGSTLRDLCASSGTGIPPFVLFPNDTLPYWETFNFSPAQMTEGRIQGEVMVPGILPVVNICIDYSAAYGREFKGETAISYQLTLLHGVGFSYVPVGRNVQPGEILIMPNLSGGSFLK